MCVVVMVCECVAVVVVCVVVVGGLEGGGALPAVATYLNLCLLASGRVSLGVHHTHCQPMLAGAQPISAALLLRYQQIKTLGWHATSWPLKTRADTICS